jgi:hypothetical protein
MKIQINTNESVEGDDALSLEAEAILGKALARFSEQITRLEVHLSDVNALKHGLDDKRCLLEARLAGLRPLAVSHNADTVQGAIKGAAEKLVRNLDSTLGRLSDR